MKKQVSLFFIVAVSLLAAALIFPGGCEKKKKIYFPPPSGTGTGTGTGTPPVIFESTFEFTADVPLSQSFETVEQGFWADINSFPQDIFFFSTQGEFDAFYLTLHSSVLPPPTPPTVDFLQYRVVAFVDETQVSTGYSVEILSVEYVSAMQYEAAVLFTQPGVGWIVFAVMTKPYHIVKVTIP